MDTVQTESTVNFAVLAKCAHTDCVCTVGSGERFCSDYCAEHAGMSDAAGGRHMQLRPPRVRAFAIGIDLHARNIPHQCGLTTEELCEPCDGN